MKRFCRLQSAISKHLKCGAQIDVEVVRQEQKEWEEKVEMTPREIEAQEHLLSTLETFFHPNHNLCTSVMFTLVSLYSSSSLAAAEKKDKLCETLLKTMELVIPGWFQMRGTILVERTKIPKKQFVEQLAGLRLHLGL